MTAVTAGINTQATANYVDAVSYPNSQVSGKQDSLQWLPATRTAFINPTDLNARKIEADGPVSLNLVESGRPILLHADCYFKSESNCRILSTFEQILRA